MIRIMSSNAYISKAAASLIAIGICFLSMVSSSLGDDMIASLPGQPPVSFKQYAGYITVDGEQERALFYYFVEAQTEPESKPLVLWLNGGPGCSSVGGGGFSGQGPFIPKDDGLMKNDFSWNKEANMLYLESPAGVGFSYSSNKSFYDFINDEITARDNLMFLFGWFEKYPAYKKRDFFITGVSYAGHYVPQLAKLILKSRLKSNLKGIAIGNPFLEFDTDYNMKGDYLWSHGLISDSTFSMLNSVCNISQIFKGFIDGSNTSTCWKVFTQGLEEIGPFVNIYDVPIDVCLSAPPPPIGNSLKLKASGLDVCLNIEIDKYLNRNDTQNALHAKLVGVDRWSHCASHIGYDERDALVPSIPLLGELVKDGIRVMVYSGDQDAIIPFIGTRTLINMLAKDLGLNTTVPYRSWLQDKQVGGWTQVYNDKLSYATVRGGGHGSAFSQPERTLLLFKTFLKGETLPSPN